MRKALFLLPALVLLGCGEPGYNGPRHSEAVTADTFEEKILQARHPVLVDFHADWCGPCRRNAPAVEAVARDHAVFKLDTDDYPTVAKEHGVKSLPTFLVFRDGRVVERMVGMRSEKELRAALERHERK